LKFGVILPNYGVYADTMSIKQVALNAEDLQYDSVWATDHLIVPAKFRDDYGITYEVFSTLAYLAGLTEKIDLGSSLIVIPMRNPISLAKQIATIDSLSNGRVIIGAGAGYMQEEFAALGASFKLRGKYFDESLRIMKTIWTEEPSTFTGDFFRFENMTSNPKPVDKGGPPIWIGGDSTQALRRVAMYGDGWHPTGLTPSQISEGFDRIIHFASEKKRKRKFIVALRQSIEFSETKSEYYFGATGAKRWIITGSIDKIIKSIDDLSKVGVEHLLCSFQMKPKEILNNITRFAKEIIPSFR
jgi:probable F420-dependent oxidoreductase